MADLTMASVEDGLNDTAYVNFENSRPKENMLTTRMQPTGMGTKISLSS